MAHGSVGLGRSMWVSAGLAIVMAMTSVVSSGPTSAAASDEVVMDRGPLNRIACPEGVVPSGGLIDTAGAHGFSVDCLVWWGITQGVSETEFAPDRELSRAQLATFLYRVLERTAQPIPDPQVGFSDVRGGPHREAIEVLATLQVIGGVGEGRFAPEQTVTRGQLAAMITRLHREVIGATIIPADAPFTDVPGTTHEQAIQQLVALGVTQGTSATTFGPGAPVLRG